MLFGFFVRGGFGTRRLRRGREFIFRGNFAFHCFGSGFRRNLFGYSFTLGGHFAFDTATPASRLAK